RRRWARGDWPLLVTNHYRGLEGPAFCPRYDYLERHAPGLPRSPSDGELLRLLQHEQVRQSITAQHVVARPAAGTLRLFVPTDLLAREADGEADLSRLGGLF